MKRILIIIVALSITGCATQTQLKTTQVKTKVTALTLEEIRIKNRQSLIRLEIGMTKSQVLEVMGTEIIPVESGSFTADMINNPYRVEAIKGDSGEMYEILFYYTDVKKRDGVITDDELTPLVIKDDKLIGWGWTFVNDSIKKYQIDIR